MDYHFDADAIIFLEDEGVVLMAFPLLLPRFAFSVITSHRDFNDGLTIITS